MKKIILISLIAGGIYLATKIKNNLAAFDFIESEIKAVRHFKIVKNIINLTLDLNVSNLSKYDLGVDSFSLVALRQLKFYNVNNGVLIGSADVNMTNIQIPANKTIILANINAQIPVNNLLKHLSLLNVTSMDALMNMLSIVPVFMAGGQTFEINPENYV
jgi:hypothetical protein